MMTPWIHSTRLGLALAAGALLTAAGCEGADAGPVRVRPVHVVQGFDFPESVRYDPDQDVYFVSSMQGLGSVRDGRAYISRIDAGDPRRVEHVVWSGRKGAVLNAPKGMVLHGDTLWVADIDMLRGFHRRTGEPLATLDLRPHRAVLLNDVAVGPGGTLYVTDSGILMGREGIVYRESGKVFRIGPGHTVSVLPRVPGLNHPNGITWDSVGGRMVVVSFDPFRSEARAIGPDGSPGGVLARGPGRFDGVEVLPDGRMLVTAWSDSSLHLIANGRDERVIRGLWQPADLGVDTRRRRVAIPLVLQGRVEIWEIPAG